MNWALMNHYDEKGEMIMPRPRGKEADEEKFIRWVCVELTPEVESDQTRFRRKKGGQAFRKCIYAFDNMT